MKEYSVVAVLWQDHYFITRQSLPKNPDDLLIPTLTVGLLVDETDTVVVIAAEIERYPDKDDATYTVIVKNSIIGEIKTFGKLKIRTPRR